MSIQYYIQNNFYPKIRARGRNYFENEKVKNLKKNANQYTATVVGTYSYDVSVGYNNGCVTSVSCNCPFYANEGVKCKHIVATLLQIDEYEKGAYSSVVTKNDKAPSAKESVISFKYDIPKREKITIVFENLVVDYEKLLVMANDFIIKKENEAKEMLEKAKNYCYVYDEKGNLLSVREIGAEESNKEDNAEDNVGFDNDLNGDKTLADIDHTYVPAIRPIIIGNINSLIEETPNINNIEEEGNDDEDYEEHEYTEKDYYEECMLNSLNVVNKRRIKYGEDEYENPEYYDTSKEYYEEYNDEIYGKNYYDEDD